MIDIRPQKKDQHKHVKKNRAMLIKRHKHDKLLTRYTDKSDTLRSSHESIRKTKKKTYYLKLPYTIEEKYFGYFYKLNRSTCHLEFQIRPIVSRISVARLLDYIKILKYGIMQLVSSKFLAQAL